MDHRHAAAAAVACALAALAVRLRELRLAARRPPARRELRELSPADVPAALKCAHFFDLAREADEDDWDRAHAAYLLRAHDVGAALDGLHDYVVGWLAAARGATVHAEEWRAAAPACAVIGHAEVELLPESAGFGEVVFAPERVIGGAATTDRRCAPAVLLEAGARVEGGVLDVSGGPVCIGAGAVIEPGALVRGPAVVGRGVVVRHGAYIRGDAVLGSRGVFGGEMKMVLALPGAELPHYGYVGDSLLGRRAHLGCGALTANFPLFGHAPSVELGAPPVRYGLGRRKFGAVVGDGAQLGCGCVAEPGTLLGKATHAYPLCRLRGAYGPDALVKSAGPRECVALRAA